MLSAHFNKETFTNTLKTKHMVTYLSTTLALMVILVIHGLIQSNLRIEYFVYAFIASLAFAVWNVIDHKCRKTLKNQTVD